MELFTLTDPVKAVHTTVPVSCAPDAPMLNARSTFSCASSAELALPEAFGM